MSLDHRYSRQSYTIGLDSQIKLSNACVLVIGYNSLAQEIIRNLALIGVSRIDIYYNNNLKNHEKSGLYFPIEKDLNGDDHVPIERISKLNPTIQINSIPTILNEHNQIDMNIILQYNSIILTNTNIEMGIEINTHIHNLSIPFIMCGCYGLMGYTFNDFGNEFIINDVNGEPSELLILDSIEGKILKFKDQHKLSEGDTITIIWNDDSQSEYNVYRKKSPLMVELKETPNENKCDYKNILRKKKRQIFNFSSLKDNIENPSFTISDWSKPNPYEHNQNLHKLNCAMSKYLNDYKQMPETWSMCDYQKFSEYVNFETEQEKMIAKKFCYTMKGDLLPLVSIIGSIVSHEILKCLTLKYIPITQWNYIDYFDLILDTEISSHDNSKQINYMNMNTRYEGIMNIFGKSFIDEFQNKVPFVIGSGAIGCEIIKNLGMMGVKEIYLTDPDHIEKSNLSRQFLFDDNDIRQSKSETVAKKMRLMNPTVQIHSLKEKVCFQTENIFNENFHSKVDIYLNALDNVEARNYVDLLAIKYTKPLIDSGTMGSKGNVQVVIPNLTESYGSSTDPEENAGIPICTIKTFPYKPEHTIQWARELFETEFNQIPNYLNKYKNKEELVKLTDTETIQILKLIYKYKNFKFNKHSYFKLLVEIFYQNHIECIKDIIDKYTLEENKESLGDKKLPMYLNETNLNIQIIQNYIIDGFELLNQVFRTSFDYNLSEPDNYETINNLLIMIKNQPIMKSIFVSDMEFEMDSKINIPLISEIVNQIPLTYPIEFEKDDDELKHVDWITHSANMRNIQYYIPQTNIYETRKIAGKIIPAMITTTSMISGFQILEYIRICKLYFNSTHEPSNPSNSDIDLYKNKFVNLNINYYDSTSPIPVPIYQVGGKNISLWTNYKVNGFDTKNIIEQIESQANSKVDYMTCGNKTIYNGEDIYFSTLENFDNTELSNIAILFEDIPIGFSVIIKN